MQVGSWRLYKTTAPFVYYFRIFLNAYLKSCTLKMRILTTTLSAQQSVELIDTYAWHYFWFLLCFLLIMFVADLYHARNGNLKWITFDYSYHMSVSHDSFQDLINTFSITSLSSIFYLFHFLSLMVYTLLTFELYYYGIIILGFPVTRGILENLFKTFYHSIGPFIDWFF